MHFALMGLHHVLFWDLSVIRVQHWLSLVCSTFYFHVAVVMMILFILPLEDAHCTPNNQRCFTCGCLYVQCASSFLYITLSNPQSYCIRSLAIQKALGTKQARQEKVGKLKFLLVLI